jgi:hypothetical protein
MLQRKKIIAIYYEQLVTFFQNFHRLEDFFQHLRRVQTLIDQSESRQQRQLALRLSDLMHDFDTQRQADMRRVDWTEARKVSGEIEDQTIALADRVVKKRVSRSAKRWTSSRKIRVFFIRTMTRDVPTLWQGIRS